MEIMGMLKEIARHPSWGHRSTLLGRRGYTLPKFSSPIAIMADDAVNLEKRGIKVDGCPGKDNTVIIDEAQERMSSLTIRLRDCSQTVVVIGFGKPFGGRLAFNGSGSLFVSSGFGMMGSPNNISITLGPSCAAFLGSNSTSMSSNWIIEGNRQSMIVGDDLMASWGIVVRNYDSHSIFDMETGVLVNQPSNLHIGPHCWIGQDAKIIRGVDISCGSIIGFGAVVTADVPAFTAVGGMPAKILKKGVSWARPARASPEHVRSVREVLASYVVDPGKE